MNKGLIIAGIILLLVGAVWTIQGLGITGGSLMTGENRWFYIGMATAIVGAALVLWGIRRPWVL